MSCPPTSPSLDRSGSGNPNAAGDLAVALPGGALSGDPGGVLRRLDVPFGGDGSGGDGVLARRCTAPLQGPQLPCKLRVLALVDGGRQPGPAVDLDLHP